MWCSSLTLVRGILSQAFTGSVSLKKQLNLGYIPVFICAQCAYVVTCIEDLFLPVCMFLQCYVLAVSSLSGSFQDLGLQHCPELEQGTEHLGNLLFFLTEKQ